MDDRLPALLVEQARARNLQLELKGTVEAIREWWRALRAAEDPERAMRHLHAVAAGDAW